MERHLHKTILSLFLVLCIVGLSACSSTRTENGVTIEQNRSLNPLNYIPGL
jgi:hypothetical protein